MANRDISVHLKPIVSTLCSSSKGRLEKRRRLLQLKYWLISDDTDDGDRDGDEKILREGSRLFSALSALQLIKEEIQESKDAHEDASPAKAIESLLDENTDFRRHIDDIFEINTGFISLNALRTARLRSIAKTNIKKINSLNMFTQYCVQVKAVHGKVIISDAKALYWHAQTVQDDLLSDIEPLRTGRRQRAAFLYVAHRYFPDFLKWPTSPTSMWTLLGKQTSDVATLKQFFAQCAFVREVTLQKKESKAQDIERWARVSADKPPVPTLAYAEIETARQAWEKRPVGRGKRCLNPGP